MASSLFVTVQQRSPAHGRNQLLANQQVPGHRQHGDGAIRTAGFGFVAAHGNPRPCPLAGMRSRTVSHLKLNCEPVGLNCRKKLAQKIFPFLTAPTSTCTRPHGPQRPRTRHNSPATLRLADQFLDVVRCPAVEPVHPFRPSVMLIGVAGIGICPGVGITDRGRQRVGQVWYLDVGYPRLGVQRRDQ